MPFEIWEMMDSLLGPAPDCLHFDKSSFPTVANRRHKYVKVENFLHQFSDNFLFIVLSLFWRMASNSTNMSCPRLFFTAIQFLDNVIFIIIFFFFILNNFAQPQEKCVKAATYLRCRKKSGACQVILVVFPGENGFVLIHNFELFWIAFLKLYIWFF